ncbi:hypothetical protein [Arthrobacter sp. CAN_C5]|uniref:hypothetical protein n=1 Tax=Arthrobacter sp. CAN_C5 TaxID=2760706 RepID=UPI001AE3F37B|nr:hypothetical protein [Arthrobacter sp. CAN_C5]MBP2216385.1 hypothetical protein [Arthrobacter sp. CAN_C5]
MSDAQLVHGERRRGIHWKPIGVGDSVGDRNGLGYAQPLRKPDAVGHPYISPDTLGHPYSHPNAVGVA